MAVNQQKLNNGGFLEKVFKLSANNTTVKTEVVAGITTFMTMAYIIIVNPIILKDAGMDFGAVMVATCVSAAVATFLMGLLANYPFALAPGMGLNAYFTYSVVLDMGYTWQVALGAVFISGLVFILITVTKLREVIVNAIPFTLKKAVGGGIGLFIALIGLQNAGIIVTNEATLVGLGHLAEPGPLLALIGLVITAILLARKVPGAMIIGILVTTVIGMLPVFGLVPVPTGIGSFISTPPPVAPTFMQLDIKGALGAGLINVILAFTFVDLFDTLGTLVGTGAKANMLDEKGRLPRANPAMLSDAIGTSVGAVFGTSTVTTFVESAAGIVVGGRTGLTAIVVGILFLASLFISPLALMIPGEATAAALILVGVMMMEPIMGIDFSDFTEAVPAFMTIALMPFTYSIANGIAAGLIFYPIMKVVTGRSKEVHPVVYILAILFIIRFFTL